MNKATWNIKTALAAIMAIILGFGVSAAAQAQEPPADEEPVDLPDHRYDLPATLITAAQIEQHKQNMMAVDETDVAMTMVPMGGGDEQYQIGVSMVVRYQGQSNQYYAVHDDVAEVYYVIEGSGRMKLGGTITDWERRHHHPSRRHAHHSGGNAAQVGICR
jgi:mannose-6-phosphate isomerase-like protein (cupin superfamily)